MYIVKIKLYCPICKKEFSCGSIKRKTLESAKKDVEYWIGIVPIFKCQRDNSFLQIDAEIEIN
ncbi:MAG: hypothetical protein WC310_05855 [Patescibacteria group bacterium]|jgi:hypothetical protein